MSLSRYRIPLKARALWRDRGESVTTLARQAGVPLKRAQYALSGHHAARPEDRRALARYLAMAEHVALGWDCLGNVLPVEHSVGCSTPFCHRNQLKSNLTSVQT